MGPISTLVYGEAGAGKSGLGVSAFWDFKARTQIRDGRWLLMGREDNDAFGVPEELIRRFASPEEQPLKFVDEFATYVQALVKQARSGKGGPEVLVLDGWTEWNNLLLYEHDKRGGSDSKWDKFDLAKDQFFATIQMLHPKVLNAHIIATARIDEKRKGILNRRTGEVQGADPEYWRDLKYIPAMVGWAKKNLNNYYDLVLYVEAEQGPVTTPAGRTRIGTHHKYYMLPHEGFLIKNRWEHLWLAADFPDYLVNATYDDLLNKLDEARTAQEARAK